MLNKVLLGILFIAVIVLAFDDVHLRNQFHPSFYTDTQMAEFDNWKSHH